MSRLILRYSKLLLIILLIYLVGKYIIYYRENTRLKALYYVENFSPDCEALFQNDTHVCIFTFLTMINNISNL